VGSWSTLVLLENHLEARYFTKNLVVSWRIGYELLPTNVKIASIRNGFNQGCPRCEAIAKTLIHALKDCPISREVHSIGGWDTSTMSRQSSNLSKDFHIYNILNVPLLSQNEAIKKWEKHQKGVVKINFDATINVNRMGYGVIIRDDDGFVLRGGGGFIDKRVTVHEVKCIVFERGIE
ncbi:hypothetical protein Godav_015127, partial [Gossypium davidsonii]|nr:hypothetical protein [Gossypium davidsonii]